MIFPHRSAARLAALAVALTLGACGGGRSVVPGQAVDLPEAGAPRLRLVRLTPAAGRAVDSATVLEAELEYSVPDPEAYPGPYTVELTFMTTSGASFRPATPEERRTGPRVEELTGPGGRHTLRYPLSLVWDLETLARPIRVVFSLQSRSAASSGEATSGSARLRNPSRMLARVVVEYATRSRQVPSAVMP